VQLLYLVRTLMRSRWLL